MYKWVPALFNAGKVTDSLWRRCGDPPTATLYGGVWPNRFEREMGTPTCVHRVIPFTFFYWTSWKTQCPPPGRLLGTIWKFMSNSSLVFTTQSNFYFGFTLSCYRSNHLAISRAYTFWIVDVHSKLERNWKVIPTYVLTDIRNNFPPPNWNMKD